MIPKAGSAYTYSYAVLGEIVGWFIGWDLLLEYTAIVAVVAIGISGYFGFLVGQLGINLPAWMLGAPGTGEGRVVDLFAVVLCLLIAFLLTLGIKTAARFETIVVIIKVAVVLLVIVVGYFHISTANYTPFFPFGVAGAITGAATVFFAVFGYDAMSTAAEESRDAQKHMPRAIIYSLVISMVLYVLACLVLTGMQNYTEIDPESGFSTAFASVGLSGLAGVIAVGAIIGILTVMFTFMLGVTRVWFSMSRDGLLPQWFAKLDPVRRVPTRVTWIVGVASAIIAGFLPIREAAELTNIGILLAFVVVVCRGDRPALPAAGPAPLLPRARHAGRAGHRGDLLDLADHVPGALDVAAVRRLVPDRPDHLLPLQSPSLRAQHRARRKALGHFDRHQLARVDVVDRPRQWQSGGQEGAGPDAGEVVAEGGVLVGHGVELQAAGVHAVLLGEGVHVGVGDLRHPAVGVRHHQHPLDSEQIHRQDEGTQDVVGDPGSRVAQDLGVTGPQAQQAEGVDAGVHAGHDGKAARCPAREARVGERPCIRLVGGEEVVERSHAFDDCACPFRDGFRGLIGGKLWKNPRSPLTLRDDDVAHRV
ncbi:hypothetical protein GCM10020219_078540 [Nonomuraea dietziae]